MCSCAPIGWRRTSWQHLVSSTDNNLLMARCASGTTGQRRDRFRSAFSRISSSSAPQRPRGRVGGDDRASAGHRRLFVGHPQGGADDQHAVSGTAASAIEEPPGAAVRAGRTRHRRVRADHGDARWRRQIFFVSLDGFDNHGDQLTVHAPLLKQVDDALILLPGDRRAWRRKQCTAFTASDFGRTISSNGRGSDHGWAATPSLWAAASSATASTASFRIS